jgi:iron complex outermembrane receptor protein
VRYFIGAGYQRRLLEESNNTFNYAGVNSTPNRATYQDQKRTFDEYTALGRFEFKASETDTFTVSPTYLRTDELRAQTEPHQCCDDVYRSPHHRREPDS